MERETKFLIQGSMNFERAELCLYYKPYSLMLYYIYFDFEKKIFSRNNNVVAALFIMPFDNLTRIFYSIKGATTETQPCSGTISNIWEYFFGTKTFGTINSSEIMEEVGPNCQCGCIIHLLKSKPRRLLASSSQACVGLENILWTIQVQIEFLSVVTFVHPLIVIQVEEGHQIKFELDYFILPCSTQSIKIRDGKDAWMSELIGEFSGRSKVFNVDNVVSSGNLMLIDFHTNDSQIANSVCYAGFIGHVKLIGEFKFVN